eukprot:COSAG01_NODE_6106_length_3848_cov_1.384102_5_plen_94_part_00
MFAMKIDSLHDWCHRPLCTTRGVGRVGRGQLESVPNQALYSGQPRSVHAVNSHFLLLFHFSAAEFHQTVSTPVDVLTGLPPPPPLGLIIVRND